MELQERVRCQTLGSWGENSRMGTCGACFKTKFGQECKCDKHGGQEKNHWYAHRGAECSASEETFQTNWKSRPEAPVRCSLPSTSSLFKKEIECGHGKDVRALCPQLLGHV